MNEVILILSYLSKYKNLFTATIAEYKWCYTMPAGHTSMVSISPYLMLISHLYHSILDRIYEWVFLVLQLLLGQYCLTPEQLALNAIDRH